MEGKTFQEWRQNNNPYENFTGLPTVELSDNILNFVYNVIDNHFLSRLLGSPDDVFKRFFIEKLNIHKYTFFTLLQWTFFNYKDFISDLINNDTITTFKANSVTDNTSQSETLGTYEAHQTGRNDSTSETMGKGRNLHSVTPNSNIADNLTTDVDQPIKWNFATDLNDSFNKTNDESTTNTRGDENGNNRNETNATSNTIGKNDYIKRVNKLDITKLQDIFYYLVDDGNNPFLYLFRKLEPCFLYKFSERIL